MPNSGRSDGDYLNCNVAVALQYQQLKKELARKFLDDRSAYTKGKQTMIIDILEHARQWKVNDK